MISVSDFVKRYPKLWHMAELGSQPSIVEYGLLSTEALLDLFEVTGQQRTALLRSHRRDSVTICHPKHGRAVVRDQKPMNDITLSKCLTDMTAEEWYAHLNRRVFFWVSEERLTKMLGAGAYKGRPHMVLEVDTAGLIERHEPRVTLSPMNSGATFPLGAVPRGSDTFQPLSTFPWEERVKTNRKEPVVELAVDYSVPDIADLLLEVTTRRVD